MSVNYVDEAKFNFTEPIQYIYPLKVVEFEIAGSDPPEKVRIRPYRVKDGDTVLVVMDKGEKNTSERSLRIGGVDTPESRKSKCGKCRKYHSEEYIKLEKQCGRKATNFTRQVLLDAKEFLVISDDLDKYAGRVIGDIVVSVNDEWYSLSALLISSNNAIPYHGKTKSCFVELWDSGYYTLEE